jgi:hypothetical protein
MPMAPYTHDMRTNAHMYKQTNVQRHTNLQGTKYLNALGNVHAKCPNAQKHTNIQSSMTMHANVQKQTHTHTHTYSPYPGFQAVKLSSDARCDADQGPPCDASNNRRRHGMHVCEQVSTCTVACDPTSTPMTARHWAARTTRRHTRARPFSTASIELRRVISLASRRRTWSQAE